MNASDRFAGLEQSILTAGKKIAALKQERDLLQAKYTDLIRQVEAGGDAVQIESIDSARELIDLKNDNNHLRNQLHQAIEKISELQVRLAEHLDRM